MKPTWAKKQRQDKGEKEGGKFAGNVHVLRLMWPTLASLKQSNAQLRSSLFGWLIKPCVPKSAHCNDATHVARLIKVTYLRGIASQHVNNNEDNEVHNTA
jgi:hypothetical protein